MLDPHWFLKIKKNLPSDNAIVMFVVQCNDCDCNTVVSQNRIWKLNRDKRKMKIQTFDTNYECSEQKNFKWKSYWLTSDCHNTMPWMPYIWCSHSKSKWDPMDWKIVMLFNTESNRFGIEHNEERKTGIDKRQPTQSIKDLCISCSQIIGNIEHKMKSMLNYFP